MRKSHDSRRDLLDTCAGTEHLLGSEVQIARAHCAAVNRDLLTALKWLVWTVDSRRISGDATDPEDLKAALAAARAAIAKAGG
jgi:hypothetical protein